MRYRCACCGQVHEGLPDIVFDRPEYAYAVPEKERGERVRLDRDLCVIDNEFYFVRGIIEIAVHGQDEAFGIGAWVSQRPENFRIYAEHMDTVGIGPFFGWLSNEISFGSEPTLNLKTMAHFRGEDCDHASNWSPMIILSRSRSVRGSAWTRPGPSSTGTGSRQSSDHRLRQRR